MQLSQSQIEDEVRFWVLEQDREHQLFYRLGIQEPALKDEAARLHAAYEQAKANDDIALALRTLEASQAFKLRALAASRRAWIGWLFPLFYEHTHAELEVFRIRIAPGGIAPRGELCAVNRFNADHVAFAAHLLDPSEKPLIDAAGRIAVPAALAANQCASDSYQSLVVLSRQSAADVDGFFSAFNPAQHESVIHPALAAHVVREGRRFVGYAQGVPENAP